MHDQTTTYEESVHTDASWDWARCNAPKHPFLSLFVFRLCFWNFLVKNLKFLNFFGKSFQVLSRTPSVVISSCLGKVVLLSSSQKSCFIISFSCYFWKNHMRKNRHPKNCLREKKNKLLFSPFDLLFILLFFEQKSTLYLFSIVLLFFSLFFSFLWYFCYVSWCFHLSELFQPKKNRNICLQPFFFELFFWRREICWTIFFVQNLSFEISSKNKNIFFTKKNNLFLFSHASRSAYTIEGSLDHCCVSWSCWARQVSCAFSCHWSRPRDIRCIKPSLFFFCYVFFFFLNKQPFCFFSNCFFFLDFVASIVLQFFHGRKSLFTLFISLFFMIMFPVFFFSLLMFCQGDVMAEDKTRHRKNTISLNKNFLF